MKLHQSVLVKNWGHLFISVLFFQILLLDVCVFLKEICHSMSFHVLGISCIKQVSSDPSNGNSKNNYNNFGTLKIQHWNLKGEPWVIYIETQNEVVSYDMQKKVRK